MTFPLPDSTGFTMNDVLVFISANTALGIFLVCSEEIIEWFGIPNDSLSKEKLYDIPMRRREYTSQMAVALTTPFTMAMCLRMIVSVVGLGPVGGYSLWVYILYLYYSRNAVYGIQAHSTTYAIFSSIVFLLALVSWVPEDAMYNLQWSSWNVGIVCLIRVVVGFLTITQHNEFTMIQLPQHILWDPLLSFEHCRAYISHVENMVILGYQRITKIHED